MKFSVALLSLLLASGGFARKEKGEEKNEIIETRNVPLAITTFTPRKTHQVRSGSKLFGYMLRITPFASQNFDGTNRQTGIRIKITFQLSVSIFSRAALVLMVDGRKSDPAILDWTVDTSWGAGGSGTAEIVIADEPRLLGLLANAKEIYVTILVPGRPPPSDQISFQMSEEQQNDCRLINDKYGLGTTGFHHPEDP
jgi:hypothetical protein